MSTWRPSTAPHPAPSEPTDGCHHIGVLTSGGDAPGMNAAVRAVVRTALARGTRVSAITEGYRGLAIGDGLIREMDWSSVTGIMQLGGTVIGTARCPEFQQREGRLQAAANLVRHGIDGLVVIGGDGSLTGADVLRREWPDLMAELVATGRCTSDQAERAAALRIVGLVGSIDNDMAGTDMTIGADTALHRITNAIDAITSTAASHQRTFVVEVMGRHCGYLALYGGLAGGADWVIIPEAPAAPDWEDTMAAALDAGRASGRRDSIVVVSEGAVDHNGVRIDAERVRQALETRLGVDCRVTVLGHVQRGGSPSAFDRYMATLLGHRAVLELERYGAEPVVVVLRNGQIRTTPLMSAVEATRAIGAAMESGDRTRTADLRGSTFASTLALTTTLVQVAPRNDSSGPRRRIALLHGGGLAPGMNTATRVAVRLATDRGHEVLGVIDGFDGLVENRVRPLDWMDVSGWGSTGGAELGVARRDLSRRDLYDIARTLDEHHIDALIMIGGWSGYEAVHTLHTARASHPAFDIPLVCVPASIDNNLPGSSIAIGSDTALNGIVSAVDRIKQSAVAAGRCFVVEVMGRRCGYLALMSGLATGADRVLLHEDGVHLDDLRDELDRMTRAFADGKRLNLVIRNERANDVYTTGFITDLFEEEGGDLFTVRQAILGHLQQGGDPSPFDRILASRFAQTAVDWCDARLRDGANDAVFLGIVDGRPAATSFDRFDAMADREHERPTEQHWLPLQQVMTTLAHRPESTGPS